MSQYKQLTREQRYMIFRLKQENFSNRRIAGLIKVHYSTVYRELSRNIHPTIKAYRPAAAHTQATARRKTCRKPTILTRKNRGIIAGKLKKHWSPEQISGWLKRHDILNISHQTIYNYINKNREQGGVLYKNLRRKSRYRKRRSKSPGITDRIFIDERPDAAKRKTRIGDWEVDTIISRSHHDVLVSMVERYSKFTLISKAESKHAYHVSRTIRNMFRRYDRNKILTITSDNGTEFAQHKLISKWLNADYYFCHPYSSWERGLNENTNGLIRQYVPKGTSFSHLQKWDLIHIRDKLNHRPRKSLSYLTPYEVFHERSN